MAHKKRPGRNAGQLPGRSGGDRRLHAPAPPPAQPRPKSGARRRARDGLVGLGAVVVLSVYGLGYLHTRSAADQANVAEAAAKASAQTQLPPAPTSPPPSSPTASPQSPAASARAPATATSQPQGQQAAQYRDGTYVGRGTSNHGDIQATVVVKNGAIVSASVSRCGTQYTCAYVAPLVKEVVSRQGAPVHYISGATASSSAYRQAILQALGQAG